MSGTEHRRIVAARSLTVAGVLLLLVAGIHLAVIPLLRQVLLRRLSADAYAFVAPPFFLNHVGVGVLLFPFGFSTIVCAGGIRRGQRWAWWIGLSNAVAVLVLPVVLLGLMGFRYFKAVPFLVAALSVTAAGLALIIPLLWVGREIVGRS